MNWINCYSHDRWGIEYTEPEIRNAYERDWDRIIFSSPFRRLQNKTQVFPLPEEIFVHNRLTHSLEVASVGRSLGQLVGEGLSKLGEVTSDTLSVAFYKYHLKHVIAAGCLAHDLGNPAFGHSGEEAISKYFRKRDTDKIEDIAFKDLFDKSEWQDLTHFEGNANALRILTASSKYKKNGGYSLTYSTLASIIKYPCESMATYKDSGLHRKKYGYFQIDKDTFMQIAEKLKMLKENIESRTVYKRHPFVYLVEAADDICYNIIDFEDAHRLGILGFDEVKNTFLEIISKIPYGDNSRLEDTIRRLSIDKNECISYLRAKVINVLTLRCADIFFKNEKSIISGNYNKNLIDDIPELADTFKYIYDISKRKIYNAKNVVQLEIAGFKIISGLVEDFVNAAITPKKNRDKEQEKILELLPIQFKFDETSTPYIKIMHIIDFISGMTDVYALKLYRKLRGIEI